MNARGKKKTEKERKQEKEIKKNFPTGIQTNGLWYPSDYKYKHDTTRQT